MKIINLMEDTAGCSGCLHEHGLSFYIETKKHRLLSDTGATGAFLDNAGRLGVDLKTVDTVILSNGHYDHTGGVLAFAEKNPKARIYLHTLADGDYYNLYHEPPKYIGIDRRILALPQLVRVNGDMEIDGELSLFSGICGARLLSGVNQYLKQKKEGAYVQDTFAHEQCLVITQDDGRTLLSGCAHNGIVNILDRYYAVYGSYPDRVISGFHLMQKTEYTKEDIRIIEETAQELSKMDTVFYTGHCTGQAAFDIMKEIMGEKLFPIHSGARLL